VDVSGDLQRDGTEQLSFLGVLFHGFHIMTENLIAEKLRLRRPDIYIRPEIHDVRVLEFYKARQVFADATPAGKQLKKSLQSHIAQFRGRPGCSMPGAA
jgi:NTE family protein